LTYVVRSDPETAFCVAAAALTEEQCFIVAQEEYSHSSHREFKVTHAAQFAGKGDITCSECMQG
jgi:hypothetical protein